MTFPTVKHKHPSEAQDKHEAHWKITTKWKMLTWQFGDRRSHSLMVLSNEPEINVSSTGDMEREVTLVTTNKANVRNQQLQETKSAKTSEQKPSSDLLVCPGKYRMYLLS